MAYISLDVLIVVLWLGFWGAVGGLSRLLIRKRSRKKNQGDYFTASFLGAFTGVVVTSFFAKSMNPMDAIAYAGLAGFAGPHVLYALMDRVFAGKEKDNA